MAKTFMSPYIVCKVLTFSKIICPKLFGISGSDFHKRLKLLCSLVIQRAYFSSLDSELKAYANETKHVNKASPIHILNRFIFINYHLGSWWTIGATINVIFFFHFPSFNLCLSPLIGWHSFSKLMWPLIFSHMKKDWKDIQISAKLDFQRTNTSYSRQHLHSITQEV